MSLDQTTRSIQRKVGATQDGIWGIQTATKTDQALGGEPAVQGDAKRIYIDVGHGMKPDRFDPGAVHAPSGTTEHSLNLLAATECARVLREAGHEVHIDDDKVSNYQAGRDAAGYNVLASIHHNSVGTNAQGSECLYHKGKSSAEDKSLAVYVSEGLSDELEIKNRGAKPMRLSVLSGAKDAGVPAAVLAEVYFIQEQSPDNPPAHQMGDWSERGGAAIGRAIDTWLKR